MPISDLSVLLAIPSKLAAYLTAVTFATFISPGSTISLASLFSALIIAIAVVLWRRRPGKKPIPLKVMLRAVFPRKLLHSASSRMDVWLFLLNVFVFGLIFGWAILSQQLVSSAINGALVSAFGAIAPTSMPPSVCVAIITLALFLAYELGYWLDHYLSHTIPLLWEFHKVHHTAEVLSPLTNFRVHPFDTLVFVNILAVVMGSTEGSLNFLLGRSVQPLTLWSSNVFVLIGTYLIAHLHHTHFWIAFTGLWGKLVISPAHHQIHHSMNPAHFNRNMGSCLAVFDWMFGTLHIPAKEREQLSFGVDDPEVEDHHTVSEGLIMPVVRALGVLKPVIAVPYHWLLRVTPVETPARADK